MRDLPDPLDLSHLPDFPEEMMERAFPGGFTIRDEANALVAYAVRNGPIEDMHERITQEEMKTLMLYACEHLDVMLTVKERNPDTYGRWVRAYAMAHCSEWER